MANSDQTKSYIPTLIQKEYILEKEKKNRKLLVYMVK